MKVRAYEVGGTLEQSTGLTYDTDVLGGYYLGRLSKVDYGPAVGQAKKYTESFRYSRGGLPLKKQWEIRVPGASGQVSAEWEYNNDGQPTKITYLDGSYYEIAIGWYGRPDEMTLNGTTPEVWDVSWSFDGRLERMRRPSQKSGEFVYRDSFWYNERRQLTGLQWVHEKSQGDDNVVDIKYVYPAVNVGRILKKKDHGGVFWGVEYSYDELGRLVKEESAPGSSWSGTRTWGYDGFGNRTAVNGWGPGVDPATNRLIAAEGYSYDANGSVTLMPGVGVDKQLEWNALNRLEKVTQGAESEEYEYSPAGQRVFRKRVGGLGAGEDPFGGGSRHGGGGDAQTTRCGGGLNQVGTPLCGLAARAGLWRLLCGGGGGQDAVDDVEEAGGAEGFDEVGGDTEFE